MLPKQGGIFDAGQGAGARRSSATLSGERQREGLIFEENQSREATDPFKSKI